MIHQKFVYQKRRLLTCILCFLLLNCRLFGTKCNACFQSIPSSELVMRALSNVYHLRCFTCVMCDQQLKKGDEFVLKENRLYCKEDYTKEHTVDTQKVSSKSSSQDGRKGPKRPRTILTTSQRRAFKASFEVSSKPCRKVRETLAKETGLSVRVVQVWFQNQRAKVRKEHMKKLARKSMTEQEAAAQRRSGNDDQDESKDDDSDFSFSDVTDLDNYASGGPSSIPPSSHQGMMESPYGQDSPLGNQPPGMMNQPMYSPEQFLADGPPTGMDVGGVMDHHDMIPTSQVTTLLTKGEMEMNGVHVPQVGGIIGNPIDKLYSMQDSYFNAVE
ncbi:LIM homeobox transcription factor 1-beta-like isoform X2 [Lytechinus variegatus]|uniref:LIM homeobox transcription factor 1-beta-like isoform X2 n=1 Tax=Lytechinus variegatus TaxID=7654 RepID=UPI001BB104CB|nr:LIM homeobox transcription factor 1-beta-like isoform X2 [Lytechinus variegatus]